nr:MAG TPA: hypothetical protein [Caudoviricetes sp.]
MNSKVINNFCRKYNIWIYINTNMNKYFVTQNDVILYQSSDYQDCEDYITEMIINDKHANNR